MPPSRSSAKPPSAKNRTGSAASAAADALELDLVPPPGGESVTRPGAADSASGGAPETPPPDEGVTLLPLVPVRDSVYFPQMIFPLYVGRDRSLRALEAAMEAEPRHLILASQRSVEKEEPEPDDVYETGILVEILQVLRMPDNAVRAMMEGVRRVRIGPYLQTEPYFLVQAREVETTPGGTDVELEALVRTIIAQFEALANDGKSVPPEALVSVTNIAEPDRLTDAIIPYLSLRVDQKQDFLETASVRERLEKLNAALEKEREILEVQNSIRSRVEKEMGDSQREYLLREQMKAIRQELGERDERDAEMSEWREKIEAAGMPDETKERALKELDRFERTPMASPESGVIRNYLDWLVAMPWSRSTEERLDLDEAEAILNEDHYGLLKVKERILEFLAVRKLAGSDLKGPILCFAGPPGVGKTSLGKSIARSLGRKFIRVSIGGVRDEAEIRGHRRTYVGAMPGRILQGIKQTGYRNPVFMLDEIDKIGNDFRGDPSSALLEALDPEQNGEFSDHYLEVPFNLRDVLFITTANVLESIPPALRDRMEVIPFSGYIEAEKIAIASDYLVPKQIKEHGLDPERLNFEKAALRRIVREYTREAGVRNLERQVASVCRKVARRVAGGDDSPLTVTETSLKEFLGAPRYDWGTAEEQDEVGTATGLVYTEVGGDTVAVEVLLTPTVNPEGEGRLTLTGQLGDVMKESAQAAWSFVKSRARSLDVPPESFRGRDIHVHVPAGAVPKDGPSAGGTLATALASALTGRPTRCDLAMTGEITLRGKVLPVGGIKEKVLAAHRAGLRKVILPAENEKDLEEIPADVRAEMHFDLIRRADEALAIALRPVAAVVGAVE